MLLLTTFFLFGIATAQVCKSPTGFARVSQFLTVEGTNREYSLYVPESVSYPASLVVLFHGIASSPNDIEGNVKMTAQADKYGFVLVFPETTNKNSSTLFSPAAFNGASCCNPDPKFKDVEFARQIKAKLVSDGCVDPERVFVTGYSNGAFMTHRVGCEDSTIAKAIAIHSGLYGSYDGVIANSPWAVCDTTRKLPVLGIMGNRDIVVPFNGGNNPSPFGRSRWVSWNETMQTWATQNGCTGSTSEKLTELGDTVFQTTWSGCDVQSLVIDGMGHKWWKGSTEKVINFFLRNGLAPQYKPAIEY